MFNDLLWWMKKLWNRTGSVYLVTEIDVEPVVKKPVPRKKASVKKTQPVLAKKKPAVKKTIKK
jgi:hypothetical protein